MEELLELFRRKKKEFQLPPDLNDRANMIKLIDYWNDAAKLDGSKRLLDTNPLVTQLQTRYNLPDPNKYEYFARTPSMDDHKWSLVGHWVPKQFETDIDKLQALVAYSSTHTLWGTEEMRTIIEGDLHSDTHGIDMSLCIFMAPERAVNGKNFHLPLREFNPALTLADMPAFYMEKAPINLKGAARDSQTTRETIYNSTRVLPLDWQIARLTVHA